MNETMPPVSLLRLYRECGGEIITIGSDAHQKEYVGLYQKEAGELLQEAGFNYLTTFTCRKPEFHRL
jgi:histidinol-phosphatase (PHP family)